MAAVKSRLTSAWDVIRDPNFIRQMIWVALFWVITIVVIILNIQFLKSHYPDPARPDDLLLDLIPENKAFIQFGDYFTQSLFLLSIFYFGWWQGALRQLPKLLFLLAVMYMMRAFVINLTPLAQIQPPSENFSQDNVIAQTFYHGMYFSGHTASAFMQPFFFKGYKHRWILFALAIGAAISLIVSHSHYTIDVVGGYFVAYYLVTVDWAALVPDQLKGIPWLPFYHAEPQAAPTRTPPPQEAGSEMA